MIWLSGFYLTCSLVGAAVLSVSIFIPQTALGCLILFGLATDFYIFMSCVFGGHFPRGLVFLQGQPAPYL